MVSQSKYVCVPNLHMLMEAHCNPDFAYLLHPGLVYIGVLFFVLFIEKKHQLSHGRTVPNL
jgi:hypothetical protein